MGHKEKFENYLRNESLRELSIKRYIGAFSFINTIAKKFNLSNIEDWEISELDNNIDIIKNDEEFIEKNSRGNNMYSASLNHFCQYMKLTTNYSTPPIKPFEDFKWRWAVTTPSEGINTPEVLIGTLKVMFKHNGKKHTTQEFKDDLLKLQNKIGTTINLAKIERPLNKNIIENSGQYWKALGLLKNSSGGEINLTELGVLLASDKITYDDFIKYLYSNFKLPNTNIESEQTIKKWNEYKVEVYPIKLIFNILLGIKQYSNSPAFCYLTPEELRYVIIPLSVYPKLPIIRYVEEIIKYREDASEYVSWPNCTPGDNDNRMVREYLLFLSNFGYLDFIELKDNSKRYYLNSKSIDLIQYENEDSYNTKREPTYIDINNFLTDCVKAGLIFSEKLLTRFTASLATKPFVLLTGLSGSGKTKLAQAFAQWICECKDQYCIVPVGADWINREPLLGYVNALDNRQYILPENGALELILRANEDKKKPYFLVLDEMNLSHVERYFADFLSVMESKDKIKLHSAEKNLNNNEEKGLEDAIEVPKELSWPENLFVIGTVNIDETTYMFSPKVLDRANVIEFRISSEELDDYFESNNNQLNMQMLCVEDTNIGKGAKYGESFVSIAKNKEATKDVTDLNKELKKFFEKLQEIGAEFGYRSASEIQVLFNKLDIIDISYSSRPKDKIDIAIMQKLLPKLHGSRSKLVDVLFVLASFCYDRDLNEKELKKIFDKSDTIDAKVIYPVSLEKINRMYRNVIDNGFTSYAEA